MSPPIRSPEHQRRLKAALAGGVLGVVATDHAPFNSTQKRLGARDFRRIPNGVNGIEERLHVTWDALVASGAASRLLDRPYSLTLTLTLTWKARPSVHLVMSALACASSSASLLASRSDCTSPERRWLCVLH